MINTMIVVAGPTASGKSSLGISLAKKINGQIISTDSMQVYKGMDIGTAKIRQMEGIAHHLIDVVSPMDDFNIVMNKAMADRAVDEIYKKNQVPILVGGTGFYIQAILYDIDFSMEAFDENIRRQLEERARNTSPDYLHDELKRIDPKSADIIHANNVRRVIRALEFYYTTGQMISEHNDEQRKKKSKYDLKYFVLNMPRDILYKRIDKRVDEMITQGLEDEVKSLINQGVPRGSTAMQAIGYKEMLSYIDGMISLDEAIDIIKRESRHYAKRQLTWFRREKDAIWIDVENFDFDSQKILGYMLDVINE